MTEKKLSMTNTLAIMSIFLVAASAGSVGAAVQPMIRAFPAVAPATVRLVTTIPSMTGMIVTFLVGFLAGKKVSFKAICLFGAVCMLLGGVLPVFLTGSIYTVLACRLLFGVGTGCFGIRNALVLRTYPAEKRANMIGKGMFTMNLASIVMSSLAGILADRAWNLAFAIYFVCAVTVVMTAVFLKEPEAVPAVSTGKGKTASKGYPAVIFALGLFLGLASACGYLIIIGISSYLSDYELGSAGLAGTVISMFSIGGVAVSFFFGKIYARLKKANLPVFLLVETAGLCLILLVRSMPAIYVGAFLTGAGFSAFMSTVLAYAGMYVGAETVTSATTVIMTINQVFIILSSYLITIAGKLFRFYKSEVAAGFLLGAILLAVVAAICVLGRIYPPALAARDKAELQ